MPQTRSQMVTIIARALSSNQYVVEHDCKNHKFVIKLDPGTKESFQMAPICNVWLLLTDNNAFIDYEELNNNEVLLYHTEVPATYGGKGIGKILAEVCWQQFVVYNMIDHFQTKFIDFYA